MAAIIVLGRVVLPRAFAAIARQRSPEAFAIAGRCWPCWPRPGWRHKAGLSPALGAFMVGVLLSGSPFHHQIAAEVTPFKGLLLGLFFISVGMSIDLSLLAERWAEIVALVAGADPAQGRS